MKKIFLIIISFFSLFKILLSNCIPNQNCLKERGECIDDICECYEQFWTLKPNKENKLPNMFCNYERRSRFLPLILEFFLPGLGHIFMKKYILGIIKFILCFSTTLFFYTRFLFHKSEKIEETITNIPINEEKLRLINNDNNKSPNIINKEELKNIKQENLNNSSFSEEFDNNNINLEKPYKANHKKIFLPLSDQVLNFISFFCLFSFFILYLFDLFAYGFAFYKDSNSVPFL